MTEAAGPGMPVQAALVSPLGLPQEFVEASSYQVRNELMRLIERDLLGPWDGELEVFPPRSPGPLERYLVGRLGPKHDVASSRERPGTRWTRSCRRAGTPATGNCRTC